MSARAKAILPLAVVIGIISFLWTELSLNFTFNWVTAGDNEFAGFGVPANFHLILPIAFITYGLFFAAGGDNAAFGKIFLATVFGSVAALITMPLAFTTANANTEEILLGEDVGPAYWGIALWVGIFAFILVMILVAGDWYYVAGTFPCFAAVFVWWIATGLDGYVPANVTLDGAEVPISGALLSNDEIATSLAEAGIPGGTGAASGLLSTPWYWVWFSTWVTLVCGCILGIVTAKIVAAVTPKPKAAPAEA